MDPVFRAGRALGRAQGLWLSNRNGSRYLTTAASELERSGIVSLRDVARDLRAIAGDWKRRASQIPQIISRIQAEGGRTYQAVSAGVLLGLSMEACQQAGRNTDLAEARSGITGWLNAAKLHSAALKDQGFVPGMRNFDASFNAIINPIKTVRQASQLRNYYQLIENLSNQVGNAIR